MHYVRSKPTCPQMKDYKYNIYLDNAATTKPYEEVVALYTKSSLESFANPSSSHHLGIETASKLNKARELILKELNLKDYSLVFTSGATEALNLIIKGFAFKYSNRGKHIISSNIEHPAVKETLEDLRLNFGFSVTYLEVNEEGKISLDDLEKAMSDKTIIVSIMAMNNEVGSLNDVKGIKSIVKKYPKCIFVSDTTQVISKEDISYNVIDAFVISSHKLHGLKNSGALIYRKNISFNPINNGGGQENALRSGTVSLPNALTLYKSLDLSLEETKKNYSHVKEMNEYLTKELIGINGVRINSPKDASPFILNFSTNKKAAVVVEAMSSLGIFVSSTSACNSKKEASSYVVNAMFHDEERAKNTLRVSLDESNTLAECEIFIKELKNILENIR